MSTEAVSKSAAKPAKGVQVHATISGDLFEKLEDHRWNVRLNMVDVVKLALTQYAEREGLLTEAPADAPKAPEVVKGAPAKA